jgi:hypothetical protein
VTDPGKLTALYEEAFALVEAFDDLRALADCFERQAAEASGEVCHESS